MTWTRHENGVGATPTFGRRRRRRHADQLRSAAAASTKCRRRRRTALSSTHHTFIVWPHYLAKQTLLLIWVLSVVFYWLNLSLDRPIKMMCGCSSQVAMLDVSSAILDNSFKTSTPFTVGLLLSVASIPMGQGGRVPPIFTLGDMPINVPPPNVWEFLFLKHQYLAAT